MNTATTNTLQQGIKKKSLPLALTIGITITASWILIAILAPWVTGLDPNVIDLNNVLKAPGEVGLLGTDHVGRDILTRIIYAARADIALGFLGVVIPMLIGVFIGLLSGYFGGRLDTVMMRLVDITVAFPFLILVLAIVAVLGPGFINIIVALAAVGWVCYARLIRAEVLVVRNAEYVLAAQTQGYSSAYIIRHHVLANTIAPVVVYMMTDAVLVILAGAGLGFLGVGIQPPTAEWGVMIANGQPYLESAWWISVFPGLAMISLGIGLVLMGDGLAQVLKVRQ